MTAPPLATMACHCTGCQKMSSSAYCLSAALPAEGFSVIAGEPVIGGLHGASKHYFCGWCMSWMFTRPEGVDMFVNIRPTLLDDTGGFAPFIETFVAEKLDFSRTGAVHGFEALPPMDAWEGLMREYEAWVG